MNGTQREILEMKVHEISVCTFPAYAATTVSARDMVNTARGVLDERTAAVGNGTAERVPAQDDGQEDAEEDRDSSKPYGDVAYADPGYQKDGKKRYPLDTKKHVKAAWSYINQAANAAAYTASQLASIKSKIKAAMAKFGVKLGDEKKTESWQLLCDFREMTEGYDPEGDLSEVSFGVRPGEYVRCGDANELARAIKDAYDSTTRVAAIDLAANLGLSDLLPDHWGSNGEIGAVATDDTHRDMTRIYELASDLPATHLSLDIVRLAEPYLSSETREKQEEAHQEREDEELDFETMRQRFQEARDRLHALDKG
jgi:hypothetical protein